MLVKISVSSIQWISNQYFFCSKSRWIINSDAFVDYILTQYYYFFLLLEMNIKFKIILCVNLVYVVAMAGTFLASDGLFIISFGVSIDSYLFIALIWGNGDTDQRKKSSS
jgi:hypothetical protein